MTAALIELGDIRAWRQRGACRGTPIEWWYPDWENDSFSQRRQARDARRPANGRTYAVEDKYRPPAEALARCAACIVRGACLEHALRHERVGIWAGTTGDDRVALRRSAGVRLYQASPDDIFPIPEPPADVEPDDDDEDEDARWQL